MEKTVRPPIVVVVGHVDHGKTSLLDAIRKTSVTKREAGGITQSIGATTTHNITFIDTPGHALFSNMRSRGINLADIGVLVVAADDGVQPQTEEALLLLQESKIPFVVAITKVDLPTANIETTLQSLEKKGVYFEKRGGDTPYIEVSSKTGTGINELLDLINLIAEVNEISKLVYDKKGLDEEPLMGFVIETSKDKRGLAVSVIVKNGKIKVGDTIFAEEMEAKVKGIFDENQKPIKEIRAGFAGQILGFNELPTTGSQIASNPIESKPTFAKASAGAASAKLKIFVKAKTAGSLEALLANLPSEVAVIGSGVGDLTESDVFFAKAGNVNIYLFESKFSSGIRKLSETEGVKIERYDVVYDLLETLKEIIKKGEQVVLGKVQIVAVFPFNDRKIAGSKVITGKVAKSDHVKLMRGEKEIGKVKILSIRKQKDEVNEVKQGEECGILFAPQLDFQVGDVLLSVTN